MRTLLLALLAGFFTITAEARHKSSSQLNIRLSDYGNYTVVFNNTTYFATERVRIFNIYPGKHYLRIVETVQPRYYGSRAIGKRVIYEGYVTIPPHSAVFSIAGRGCGFEVARIAKFDRPNGHKPKHHGGYYDDDRDYDQQGGYYRDDDDRDYESYNDDDGRYHGGANNGGGGYDDGTYGDSRLVSQPKTPQKPMEATDRNLKKK